MANNIQGKYRKFLLTINNPKEHNITQESIIDAASNFKLRYMCMALEIGGEKQNEHIHVYLYFSNAILWATIKKLYPEAHIDIIKAMNSQDVRAYIRKDRPEHHKKPDGLYDYTDESGKRHYGQNLSDTTFFEYGECPNEEEDQGKRTDLQILYQLISDGYSTAKILAMNPNYIRYLNLIDRTREIIREEEYREEWRDIYVEYRFGTTNTNKTRTVMERYGYSDIYRISNYSPQSIWDGYRGEKAILFEEYHSQIPLTTILTWTEGYPNNSLPARYQCKTALYNNVVFCSNIPLEKQYTDEQREDPETWQAFLRRINKVYHHISKDNIIEYNSVEKYLHRNEDKDGFMKLTPEEIENLPFK